MTAEARAAYGIVNFVGAIQTAQEWIRSLEGFRDVPAALSARVFYPPGMVALFLLGREPVGWRSRLRSRSGATPPANDVDFFTPMKEFVMSVVSSHSKAVLFALATVTLCFTAPKSHAQQIGNGSLSAYLDNGYVSNGGSDTSGTNVAVNSTVNGTIYLHGVSLNGGPTTFYCIDSSGAENMQIYSGSTTTDTQINFQWPVMGQGPHTAYCSATWSGNHVNGTVTTSNVNFSAN